MMKRNRLLPGWITEHVNGKFFWDVSKTFVGVFLAFSLSNWNDEQRLHKSEMTALKEIEHELTADIADLESNIGGHELGVTACKFFKKQLYGDTRGSDSIGFYLNHLLREFIALQHSAAYESLKSRGLEIIKDDSLRLQIVNVYDFQYEIIQKLEEKYEPHEFFKLYYHPITNVLAPLLQIDAKGTWTLQKPISSIPEPDRTRFRMWLGRLQTDRKFLVYEYSAVLEELKNLKAAINQKLAPH